MNKITSLDKENIFPLLERVGNILKHENENVTITAVGGVVGLLYFGTRESTPDIDAVFPEDHFEREALRAAYLRVGLESNLDESIQDDWINNTFEESIGLKAKGEKTLFSHGGLTVISAKFEELLAHRLCSFRNTKDFKDARAIFLELSKDKSADELFEEVWSLRDFGYSVSKEELFSRFNKVANFKEKVEEEELVF